MPLRFFLRFLVISAALLAGACSDGGDDLVKMDQPFTLSGIAANGPLDGATVEVFSPGGKRLGSTQTDAQGAYSLKIDYAPPYRVSTSGGQYSGQSYTGSLSAWCDERVAERQVRCDLTPLSSVATVLMDRGYNNDEGEALLEQRYGQLGDPFTRELRTGETVSPDEFNLAAARTAINNGQNLSAWASDTADWVEDPVNSSAPPGTPEYSIALNAGTGGSGTPDPATVLMDEQAVFTLTPDIGYHLVSVTGCGGTLSGSTYTTAAINDVTAGNGDCDVTASFAINQYSVSYSAGTGGSLSGTADQTVAHGDDADAVSAVAATGYSFSQWSDGVITATRTDTNVTADLSATAQFSLNQYTLTYTPGTGGTISGTSPQTVDHGSDGTTVTAVADTGYTFSQWSDGVLSASRTDTGVTGDINATAQFTLNQYTLTYSAEPGGSINGTSPQTVSHGSDGTTVTAVPDNGYAFTGWSDGVSTATRTDTNVSGDINATARFQLKQYNLTYNAGTGGSITGTSPQTVGHGSDGTSVTAVADAGYTFDQWSDGVTTATRTDTNVTGDISVTAGFIPAAGTPGGVTAGGGDTEATVSWNPVSGADSYNLYYAADSSITPDNYSTLPEGTRVTGVTSTHTVTGLTNGTTYSFIVTAVQSGVEGSASTTVSATPEAPLTPWLTRLHEGRLQVDVRGPAKAIVDWPTTAGETYNLYVAHDPTTDLNNYAAYGATLQTGVSPSLTLDNLSAGEPVYLALEVNGTVTDWTAMRGKTWGVDSTVNAQAFDASGSQYIGGSFANAIRNTGGWVGVPAAEQAPYPDHGLALPTVNGQVRATEPDGSGGWYIGGTFTSVGGKERLRLAHINATGQVTAWNPGANSTVFDLEIANGVIYVGGLFTAVGGGTGTMTRNRLAAFDTNGQLLSWNPGVNDTVRDLEVADGVIYVAGYFTAAGGGTGTTTRNRLAAFDANGQLLSWNPGANSSVLDLEVADGVIYVAGYFTAAGGGTGTMTRNRLAAFDTNGQLLSWNPGASNAVRDLEVVNGVIYAGGYFTAAGGGTATTSRARLAAFDVNGQLLPWAPGVNNPVLALEVANGVIYAGGYFTVAGGGTGTMARNHLAAFDTNGQLLPWNPGTGNTVLDIKIANGVVHAGGQFVGIGTTPRARLAAFDNSGELLPWNPGAGNTVLDLDIANGVIYAGGYFTVAGGGTGTTTRNRLAAFDTNGQLLSWNPGANNVVREIQVANGVIYAGGQFTAAGGGTGTMTRNRLAAFDTNGQLLSWNPGANDLVHDLEVANGVVYASGHFTAAGGGAATSRNHLAAFDTNGQVLPWNPGADNSVVDIEIANGVIYAGGHFRAAGGGTATTTRNHLAAFDTNGQLLSWNPGASNTVWDLEIANGVIHAGGSFTGVGGGLGTTTRYRLAAFDTNGQVLSWNPGANSLVNDLAIANDDIYAGGAFSAVGGGKGATTRRCLAAFDETGNVLEK